MGRYTYEEPISELFSKPYNVIVERLVENPDLNGLIFRWLCLTFFKVHLKDKSLLLNRDIRIDSGYLGDNYFWEEMHHIHCIARSHYTDAIIEPEVFGTMYFSPSIINSEIPIYDYADNAYGKTIMVKFKEFCVIACLDDSCAGATMFKQHSEKINAPLTPLQMREVVAHLNYININLMYRPEYFSCFNKNGDYKISAKIPDKVTLFPEDDRIESIGAFLKIYADSMIGAIDDRDKILNEIGQGKRSYLFKGNYEFNDCSKILPEKRE